MKSLALVLLTLACLAAILWLPIPVTAGSEPETSGKFRYVDFEKRLALSCEWVCSDGRTGGCDAPTAETCQAECEYFCGESCSAGNNN